MEKEQQEDAAVTHNDVHKDWKLVLAILHEKELADVDGDKNELDLTEEWKVLLSYQESQWSNYLTNSLSAYI